jgi:chemotaxis protein methyltransferase CheR
MSARAAEASPSVLHELAIQIAERTGLTGLTLSHENLQRALTLSRVADLGDLERSLREGRLDWDSLIDALTVRETYFFRHPDQFEELRRRVLPTLHGFLRDRSKLRVWSAGCASGEEAYSLAIVFENEGLGDQTQIIATDIAPAALERGRVGHYREWSLRSLQPDLRARYFRSEGGGYSILESLREQIIWRQLNLADPVYPSLESSIGHLPLIFCRNVLMFFDAKTIAQVAARLWASLVPGGWLFLGPSDPNVSAYADFEVHVTPAGLMYRRPSSSFPRTRSSLAPPLPAAMSSRVPAGSHETTGEHLVQPAAASSLPDNIRSTWNAESPEAALSLCEAALQRSETSLELHHLHGLLLWELQRHSEAAAAMRRVLYLDPDNAIAHFGLANLLERQSALAAARRSYQNVLDVCDKLPPDAPLPLGEGICVSGLHAAAAEGLVRLKVLETGSS